MFLSCSCGSARHGQENEKMIKAHTLCERQNPTPVDDFFEERGNSWHFLFISKVVFICPSMVCSIRFFGIIFQRGMVTCLSPTPVPDMEKQL